MNNEMPDRHDNDQLYWETSCEPEPENDPFLDDRIKAKLEEKELMFEIANKLRGPRIKFLDEKK